MNDIYEEVFFELAVLDLELDLGQLTESLFFQYSILRSFEPSIL